MQMKHKEPSPLLTPRQVAHLWNVSPRTVVNRTKPGSKKRNRLEPCMLTPDLRWKRVDVYADLDATSFARELERRDGRKRRIA